MTEIKHDAATNELQISSRIFADDLENVLKKQSRRAVDIIHPANRTQTDSLIAAYVSKHLVITVDGKAVKLHYIGYKIEEEAAWCFLEAENIKPFKQVHVKDDILYAEHPNQINMIHVILHDERKSTKLDNPNANADIVF
ncbi:hypothetical protein GCM10022209_39130 [Chitinophaga oryziterrae]